MFQQVVLCPLQLFNEGFLLTLLRNGLNHLYILFLLMVEMLLVHLVNLIDQYVVDLMLQL